VMQLKMAAICCYNGTGNVYVYVWLLVV